MRKSAAYLGPAYSFCEQAAIDFTGLKTDELLPCSTIEAVFAAVHRGEVPIGIVPVENSCEGAVNQTLDLLAYDYDLKIVGEIVIPIDHHLLVRPGTESTVITHILSHPQALAQCRKTMARLYPQADIKEALSTAEAARIVAESQAPWGAIASRAAGAAYGLKIKNSNIQDISDNETRFIALGRTENQMATAGKTSLLIHTRNQPGALYKCLQEFYVRGINLNKIESRPAKKRIGQYLFFIDIDGNIHDENVAQAINALNICAEGVRFLGSYPNHR
ncbi:MAG: prephenate dehydratase [Syntrophomonadaceae bacterium]|jgi:prephenate dehydratase